MILYLVESTTKLLVSQGDADVPGFSHRNTGCTGQDNDITASLLHSEAQTIGYPEYYKTK